MCEICYFSHFSVWNSLLLVLVSIILHILWDKDVTSWAATSTLLSQLPAITVPSVISASWAALVTLHRWNDTTFVSVTSLSSQQKAFNVPHTVRCLVRLMEYYFVCMNPVFLPIYPPGLFEHINYCELWWYALENTNTSLFFPLLCIVNI